MKSKNLIIIFLYFFSYSLCYALDWKVYTSSWHYDTVYYSFQPSEQSISNRGLVFHPLRISDPIVKSYEKPFEKYKKNFLPINEQEGDYYYYTIILDNPVIVSDSLFLYYNLYTKGIDSLLMWVRVGNDYYKTNRSFETDYFQFPQEIPFNAFISADETDSLAIGSSIEEITLLIHKKKEAKKYDCVVGELKIYEAFLKRRPAKGMFFYGLTGSEDNYPRASSNKWADYGFVFNPIFNDPVSNQYFFELVTEENKEQKIIDLLYSIIEQYPYYSERNLDRNAFLSGIYSVIQDSTKTFQEKLDFYKERVTSLHDGHFFFPKPETKDKDPEPDHPFRIGRHLDGFYITAISELCPEEITVGMKINKINDTFLDHLYDSLRLPNAQWPGILKRICGDTAILTTVEGKTVAVFKQPNVEYASNYYRPEVEFRFIDDKYVYFSFGGWVPNAYLYLTNKLRDIDKEKIEGFIFDLRNNPGGDEITAMRIASMFIDKPKIFEHSSYNHRGEHIMESAVIIPDKNFNYAGKKVTILINAKTACASEIFIANMQKYANAIAIGQQKTAGAFAAVHTFHLPDDIVLHTNMLNRIEFPDLQIEYAGIKPDLYVYPYNPGDLFPHDDKILQKAVEYLNLQNTYF